MSSVASSYHLPNLHHHHHEQGSSPSVPTTPKSSGSNQRTVFRYDPYNNFSRVYLSTSPTSRSNSHSAATTPRGNVACEGNDTNKKEYSYKNEHTLRESAFVEELDEIVSTSGTPTNRMETEQNFPPQQHKRQSSISSHSDEEMMHNNNLKYSYQSHGN